MDITHVPLVACGPLCMLAAHATRSFRLPMGIHLPIEESKAISQYSRIGLDLPIS